MFGEIIVKIADIANPDNSNQCIIEDELIIGREYGDFVFKDNINMLPKNWIIKRIGDDLYLYDIYNSTKNPSQINQVTIEAGNFYPIDSGDKLSIGNKTYIITFWFSDPNEIELKMEHPFVETCIKMYKANQNDDMAVFAVFQSLAIEAVYLPMNDVGNLVSLKLDGGIDIIPIFTKTSHLGDNEPIKLCHCKLVNCLEKLLMARRNMIINPFSDELIQFVLPYESIEKMLIPAIEHEYRVHREENSHNQSMPDEDSLNKDFSCDNKSHIQLLHQNLVAFLKGKFCKKRF